jgi:hypothetical protein
MTSKQMILDDLTGIAKQILPKRIQRSLKLMLTRMRVSITRPGIALSDRPPIPAESPFAFPISKDNILEKLGTKYRPTKRTHNYLPYYWMHFRDIRFDVKKVIEIGVQTDHSILMWEAFFPNATIYGIDIDPKCKQFEGGRRKIFIGDQSNADFFHQVMREIGGDIDIIIDDGSHRIEHQLKSFSLFFPTLTDHGIYVVEDTGGVVGDQDLVTVNALKELVDNIMYWPRNFDPVDWPYLADFPDKATWLDRNVIGVAFYRWIVFVMRGKNPQDNPYLKPRALRSGVT